MHTVASIFLTVVLTACGFCSSSASETANIDEDSLRVKIGQIMKQCEEFTEIGSRPLLDSAILLLDSSGALIRDHFGMADTLLARMYSNLSRCCLALGNYDRSATVSSEAFAIWSAAAGDNHLRILDCLDVLVDCGLNRHDLIASEQASERRFEILESCRGSWSQREAYQMVKALNDRGRLRVLQNRFDDAMQDFQQGLGLITEEIEDGPHLKMGLTGNIAWLLTEKGDLAEAEKYLRLALELAKEVYPPKPRFVLTEYGNLSYIAETQGRYSRANMLSDSALLVAKELYGPSHPVCSDQYDIKARILVGLDSLESAVDYAERAVAINREPGDYPTRRLMNCLWTDGTVAFAAGKPDLAGQRFSELVALRHAFLNIVFGYASEADKLAYLQWYPPIIYNYLSGAMMYPDEEVNRGVMHMVLTGKGLAIDALASEQSAAVCSSDPIVDSLLAARRSVCSEIAQLALSSQAGKQDVSLRLRDLYSEKDRIELDLSVLCSHLDFGTDFAAVSASAVASVLPEQSVLWEFVRYYRSDLGKPHSDSLLCYIAMALDSRDKVNVFDLGEAASLDSLIDAYHAAMAEALDMQWTDKAGSSMDRYEDVSAALYEHLVEPLRSTLEHTNEVFVAADGKLNLLPFETLTKDGEKYLVEDHRFVYLTSGRDLLKERHQPDGREAIVIADPDFMIDPTTLPMLASETSSLRAARGSSKTPECLASMFPPLPMTRQEGSVVADLLGKSDGLDVSHFQAREAREGMLKCLQQAPRVLHIATHGYFCAEADRDALSNPLLRSGLVLAGANRSIGQLEEGSLDSEDGILTALEASGLNLIGTDLVVLSACQTGIGEVQSGEGVFGLRRAFQHAGARSLITSMFAVPDESTVTLMERFYENWLSGESKSSALRNASLSILQDRRKNHESTHPLFWGGFILVSDPN